MTVGLNLNKLKSNEVISIEVNQTYESRCHMLQILHQNAIQENKDFVLANNNNKTRFKIGCVDLKCRFLLKAISSAGTEPWVVTFFNAHNSPCEAKIKTSVPPKVAALILKEEFRHSGIVSPTRMQRMSEMHVTQNACSRMIKEAQLLLYGDRQHSYSLLPGYFRLLKDKMPGTVTVIESGDDGEFSRCFLAFEASIQGFQYCKPVFGLDGCHIKSQYLGVMLIAVAIDANGHTFPLAFSVVDTESTDTWTWFLENLRQVYDLSDVTIISDRQKGLINATRNVLSDIPHASCVKHLADNANGRGSKKARPFIFRLAKAKNVGQYENIMTEMATVSQSAADYITRTANPENWVEFMFPGNRWGHTTSNVVESFNAAINEARQQPIVQMFETIRAMLARWFVTRRKEAREIAFPLVPRASKILEERLLLVRNLRHVEVDINEYEVYDEGRVFNVNVEDKSCTCCDAKEGIPCSHLLLLLSATGSRRIEYCANQHTTLFYFRTYEGRILSVDDVQLRHYLLDDDVEGIVSGPPIAKPRVGRPKIVRMKKKAEPSAGKPRKDNRSSDEPPLKRTYTCGKCGGKGHSKRSCTSN
ncbi:hypothetical protein GEMRC1_010356 [Eukaryota sp. GEM-RC1]